MTVTIVATINSSNPPGTTISNQGTVSYDADGNGTNESNMQTNDPGTGTAGDATAFVVGGDAIPAVPALSPASLIFMSILLAAAAMLVVRRLS